MCTVAVQDLVAWSARTNQRNHLASLPDEMLKDIGLTRYDVEREVQKPFWKP